MALIDDRKVIMDIDMTTTVVQCNAVYASANSIVSRSLIHCKSHLTVTGWGYIRHEKLGQC